MIVDVIAGNSELSVYVPAGRVIVSVPDPAEQPLTAAFVFAAVIASRSEQLAPVLFSSAVVVTVIPAA